MKTISVIIPCYNAVKFIEQCMKSLENQTIGIDCLELIFVNDASTDDTLAYLDSFSKKYPDSVKVIDSKENRHQGGARNIGLMSATGKYVAFADDDDILEDTMLKKLYDKAESEQCDMVVCYAKRHELKELSSVEMGRTGKPDETIEITNDEKRIAFLKRDVNRAIWNKLYKRTVLTENKITFLEHMNYDDIYFSGLVKQYVCKVGFCEEYLYHHIVHSEAASLSAEKWEDRLGYFEANTALMEAYKSRGIFQKNENYYEETFIIEYIAFMKNFIKLYSCISFDVLESVVRSVTSLCPHYYKNKIVRAYLDGESCAAQDFCRLLFADFSAISAADGERVEGILIGDPAKKRSVMENILALTGLLESMTGYLLTNQMVRYNDTMKELSDLVSLVFPTVIASYSKPELHDFLGDAMYWSSQLNKIVNVLGETDRFKIADVLYFETRENLKNYKTLIEERGIKL